MPLGVLLLPRSRRRCACGISGGRRSGEVLGRLKLGAKEGPREAGIAEGEVATEANRTGDERLSWLRPVGDDRGERAEERPGERGGERSGERGDRLERWLEVERRWLEVDSRWLAVDSRCSRL